MIENHICYGETHMDFIKMHGLGNDFIIVDQFALQTIEDPASLAKKLCPRGLSVGADGLVLVLPSDIANARMRIFNPDGSEPEMCGNAVRCAARFLYESGHLPSKHMSIETLAGIMEIDITIEDGKFIAASVDMGAPEIVARHEIHLGENSACFTAVSTGNPHAITRDIWPTDDEFHKYGPFIERHSLFPAGTNVEFMRIESPSHAVVRVWERGAGPTLACGTGATASFFSAVSDGLMDKKAAITLPGGDLEFELMENGHVIMTGPAAESYRGHIK